MSNPEVAFGLAAPYEQSPDLEYQELFAMTWNLIVPRGHRIAGRRRVKLEQLRPRAAHPVRAGLYRAAARARRVLRTRTVSAGHARDDRDGDCRQHRRSRAGNCHRSAPAKRRRDQGAADCGRGARRAHASHSLWRAASTTRDADAPGRAPARVHQIPLRELIRLFTIVHKPEEAASSVVL